MTGPALIYDPYGPHSLLYGLYGPHGGLEAASTRPCGLFTARAAETDLTSVLPLVRVLYRPVYGPVHHHVCTGSIVCACWLWPL